MYLGPPNNCIRGYAIAIDIDSAVESCKKYVNRFYNGDDEYLSEALFAVSRAVSKYDETRGTKFRTFAMVFVKNALHSLFRRRMSYSKRFKTRASFKSIPCANPANLKVFIAEMPGNLREIAELHWLEGFSVQKCAEVLNLTFHKARWLVEQARKWIRSNCEYD